MKALFNLIMSLFSKEKKEEIKEKKVDKLLVKQYEVENNKAKEQKAKKKTEILPIQVKNDNVRIHKELKQLPSKNKELYDMIVDINEYTQREFKKPIMITMIYRTQAEQDYLYRNSAKYKKRKFKSPHQFWHSIDLRSRTFTSAEIKKIVAYVNKKYNKNNFYKWTAKNHTIGAGMHFHLQLIKE